MSSSPPATLSAENAHASRYTLPENFSPSLDDVIIGRGKKIVAHNKRFLEIIAAEGDAYATATSKALKSTILMRVMHLVRNVKKGNFVKLDAGSGRWFAVEDSLARTTIAQALRDANNASYRSSKQYKQRKRKQAKVSPCLPEDDRDTSMTQHPPVLTMMTAMDCALSSQHKKQRISMGAPLFASSEEFQAIGCSAPTSDDPHKRLRDILDDAADMMDFDLSFSASSASPQEVPSMDLHSQAESSYTSSLMALFDPRFVDEAFDTENPFEPTPIAESSPGPSTPVQAQKMYQVCPTMARYSQQKKDAEDEDAMDCLDILDIRDIRAAFAA